MPRPFRRRRIRGRPDAFYFKPRGIRMVHLDEITLNMDEFEAIRLKDYLEKDQEEACKEMDISQPTFHRLLNRGRKKIAEAIVKGKAIKIESKSNSDDE